METVIQTLSAEGRENTERQLSDILKHVPSNNIRALVLESYVQQYGPVSDENGEIIRQILEENA
uniref:Uncharacterized protein n=1 Tax=uncultured bacterium Contig643 TaxID=1393602 RepID=W0FMN5_9BACT|nr:predicted protein [uncultured bacterium Contig643]